MIWSISKVHKDGYIIDLFDDTDMYTYVQLLKLIIGLTANNLVLSTANS